MSVETDSAIDGVTASVLRYKFDSIAEEMESTLLRSAYSSIVKEAQDASTALFDARGRTVAQSSAIPAHLGSLIPAVESILDVFPREEMERGDIYMMNDPYLGGSHLPDIIIAKPIFNDGEIIALGATLAHHQEMGGKTPGSIPTDATEIYQEGLRFPPLKLRDKDGPNKTLLQIIEKNVRVPDIVRGDINAQISATNTAEQRVEAVANEYGNETVQAAIDYMIDHAEQLTRSQLETIPEGQYSFFDFLDDDGIDIHEPVRVEAAVEIDGSDVHVDFTGTAEQVDGPINCVPAATMAAVYYVVRAITDLDIPTNAGCFEPVSATLPEGTLVNPDPPAPVNARTLTLKRICNVMLGALAQAIPDRIPAAANGQLTSLTFGGQDDDGSLWVYGETTDGGMGARSTKDGVDCITTDTSNPMNTMAEATELEYPIRVWRYELWQDSGGPGRYRGGLGFHKRFEMLDGEVTLTHRRDRHDFHPWGLNGGKAAPRCRTILTRSSEPAELPSKIVTALSDGDVMDVFTTGGGGYGPPRARPVERVQEDLEKGLISIEAAEEDYGVVVDEDGCVDPEGSAERGAGSTERIESDNVAIDRGQSFDSDLR